MRSHIMYIRKYLCISLILLFVSSLFLAHFQQAHLPAGLSWLSVAVQCLLMMLVSWRLLSFWRSLLLSAIDAFVAGLLCAGPPWRREGLSTAGFLLGKFHGQKSLQSMELQRVGHDWVTNTFSFLLCASGMIGAYSDQQTDTRAHGAHEMMRQKLYSWHFY